MAFLSDSEMCLSPTDAPCGTHGRVWHAIFNQPSKLTRRHAGLGLEHRSRGWHAMNMPIHGNQSTYISAMYISSSMTDSQWPGWEYFVSSLITHYLIIIACIGYENMFTISLRNVQILLAFETVHSVSYCSSGNKDYTRLKWSNINAFRWWYSEYSLIADPRNHDCVWIIKLLETSSISFGSLETNHCWTRNIHDLFEPGAGRKNKVELCTA